MTVRELPRPLLFLMTLLLTAIIAMSRAT